MHFKNLLVHATFGGIFLVEPGYQDLREGEECGVLESPPINQWKPALPFQEFYEPVDEHSMIKNYIDLWLNYI